MLNRVPPCRCKRPRDTKRFIQAVPLKSSCALWTFIAAHDRCVHTNGSAIAAHNSPIMLRHCWHLLLENLRAFPIWDLQRFDFTFVGRSLCHLRGIRGWSHQWMTAPSGQFAHYLSFQQHLLIYGLLVVHVYIYIYHWRIWHIPFWSIEFKKLHHWSHIIGSIMQFPLAFWHKIGEVFPLRCLFLMRHPPAGGICQEIAGNSAFKLLDVGWPWMTLRFKHTPILEHTPPQKKKWSTCLWREFFS